MYEWGVPGLEIKQTKDLYFIKSLANWLKEKRSDLLYKSITEGNWDLRTAYKSPKTKKVESNLPSQPQGAQIGKSDPFCKVVGCQVDQGTCLQG